MDGLFAEARGPSMTSLECPHCGLISPGETEVCECGWSFTLKSPARGVFSMGPSADERSERKFQAGYGLVLSAIGVAILLGKLALGLKVSPSLVVSMIIIGVFWALRSSA
jgi:hypothetical protein